MRRLAFALPLLLVLSACGSSTEDRTISGAGIGAGAGAAVGAVTGLTIWQGALIGAAAGGVTGALTDEDDIDLGDPIWRQGSSSDQALVRDVQSGLTQLGYNPGPVDGVYGAQTREAIVAYQQDHELTVDGQPSEGLRQHIDARL